MATKKTTTTGNGTNAAEISGLMSEITNELLHLTNLHEMAAHRACNSGDGKVLTLLESMGPRLKAAMTAADHLDKLQAVSQQAA